MMDLSKSRVLVTGASGFIGSHLVEELVGLGAEVRAFVHYNSRGGWGLLDQIPKEILSRAEVVQGDIQDAACVRRALAGRDVVFHLAALIAIPYSYAAPSSYFMTNVIGTLNVMQACLDAGVGRVVHTSTSEVYGTAQYVPIDEDHPLRGQSPYSASKIGADKVAESFHLSFGLPVATLRPFNTFGPRQSARAVIPTIIAQALTQERLSLGALEPVRDFTYVKDTVRAFCAVAQCAGAIGQVLNAGTGVGISVGNLAEKIAGMVGHRVTVVREDARMRPEQSEVMRLLCDNARIRDAAGWEPGWSLDAGLRETIAWIRDHMGLYRPGACSL